MVIKNRNWAKRLGTGRDVWELEVVLAGEHGINAQFIYMHQKHKGRKETVMITAWPDPASMNEWHSVGKRPFVPHIDLCATDNYVLVQQVKYACLLNIFDWVTSEVVEEE